MRFKRGGGSRLLFNFSRLQNTYVAESYVFKFIYLRSSVNFTCERKEEVEIIRVKVLKNSKIGLRLLKA